MEIDAREQLLRYTAERFVGVDGREERLRSGDLAEVVVFEFQHDGLAPELVTLNAVPHLLAHGRQLHTQPHAVVGILGEGRLGADRLAHAVGLDLPLVDAARIAVVGVTGLAEALHERRLVPLP